MSDSPTQEVYAEKERRAWKPSYPVAVILALTGHALFVEVDTCIGYLQNKRHLPSEEVLGIRMAGTLCITLSSLYIRRVPHVPLGPPRIRRWLFIRAAVCLASIWSSYRSLWYLTTAQFTTLYNLNPLITAFVCYVGLGEHFGKRQLIACVISIFAISMVAFPQAFGGHPRIVDDGLPPPTDVASRLLGIGLGSVCVVFSAIDYFCLRTIGDQADAEQVLTTYAAFGLFFPSLFMLLSGTRPTMPSAGDLPLLLVLTLCGTAAQLTETMACATLPGATTAMLGYSGVVWGSINQTLLYGNIPSGPALIGMAIIIVAGLIGNAPQAIGWGSSGTKERPTEDEESGTAAVPLLATETEADLAESPVVHHRAHEHVA